jgi:hypothetical protein
MCKKALTLQERFDLMYSIVKNAFPSVMGITPDLAFPEGYKEFDDPWDEWEQDIKSIFHDEWEKEVRL